MTYYIVSQEKDNFLSIFGHKCFKNFVQCIKNFVECKKYIYNYNIVNIVKFKFIKVKFFVRKQHTNISKQIIFSIFYTCLFVHSFIYSYMYFLFCFTIICPFAKLQNATRMKERTNKQTNKSKCMYFYVCSFVCSFVRSFVRSFVLISQSVSHLGYLR